MRLLSSGEMAIGVELTDNERQAYIYKVGDCKNKDRCALFKKPSGNIIRNNACRDSFVESN